jgi:Flp pilus assembly protein TadD
MQSRVLFVFSLLASSSLAQIDASNIDMSSVNPRFDVRAGRSNDLDGSFGTPGAALVSASDLAVPSRARKEVDKAVELMSKRELEPAIQRLHKAIAIYPPYAVAYNNLGVIYSRLGDLERERVALQKAVDLNDHYELAYVNLGRMDIAVGDFASAESSLDKASATDPTDSVALILLSYAEFMQQHFDQTVATSRKAHALEKPHAFVHRTAARALEQRGNWADATAELEMFLKEEPNGPRADAARQELETVKAALQ